MFLFNFGAETLKLYAMKTKLKRYLHYIVIIMGMLFFSCTADKNGIPIIYLDDNIKDTAAVLLQESVNFDVPISTADLYIWNDSIAIVRNKVVSDTWFLELYDLRDNRLLRHFFRHGNGPGEMLEINFIFNNDTIVIEDFQKDNIAVIPVNKAVYDDDFEPDIRPMSIWSQYKLPFKGRLLALNPYCFINKEYGINNDGPRFIVSDSNYVYKETESYKYQTYNVSYSSFFISFANDRIVYVCKKEPVLELYDTNLNPIKQIFGPEMQSRQKYMIEENGNVCFLNTIPYAYSSFCYNDNFFYVCYNGNFLSYKNDFDTSLLKSWIFKFDWDGNFIDSYYIDHYVKSMSLSNDGRYIYAFGTDREGENVFYKYLLR